MTSPASMSPTTPYGPLAQSCVRLVTWNLWWRHGNWNERAPAIARTLQALKPDMVCLQEVWEQGDDNQAAALAQQLGLTYAFARERAEGSVAQGIALLSRWPLADVAQRALPVPSEFSHPNIALRAIVEGPRGPLLAATTHLVPFLHRSEYRERQIRCLVEFMAQSPWNAADHHGRTIMAGDFNAAPDADEIRLLTGRRPPHQPGWVFLDAWEAAGDGSPGHTVTRINPNSAPLLLPSSRWDYIFVRWPSGRPGGIGHPVHAEIAGVEAELGIAPSDHYAVAADLRY